MADVCSMAAQLITDCLAMQDGTITPLEEPIPAIARTPALESPEPVRAIATPEADQPPLTVAVAPSPTVEASLPTDTACSLPAVRPKALLGCDDGQVIGAAPAPAPALELEPPPTTANPNTLAIPTQPLPQLPNAASTGLSRQPTVVPEGTLPPPPQFSRRADSLDAPLAGDRNPGYFGLRPQTNDQLYWQRRAALRAGQLYTRIAPDSFYDQWRSVAQRPTYQQWRDLLAQEARAIARGQGHNRLTIVVGDSLALWLPPEELPRDRFWLNQSISGETTAGVLQRLGYFAHTRPDVIHVMVGVNDLKNGASDQEVVGSLQRIMAQLRRQHPQAQVVVHSILPTRRANIPSARVHQVNQQIAQAAYRQGVTFLNLQPEFADAQGDLQPALTTDGLHLSRQGYRLWQRALLSI